MKGFIYLNFLIVECGRKPTNIFINENKISHSYMEYDNFFIENIYEFDKSLINKVEYIGVLTNKDLLIPILEKETKYNFFKNKYQDLWDDLCTFGHGDFSTDDKTSFEVYQEANKFLIKKPLLFLIK